MKTTILAATTAFALAAGTAGANPLLTNGANGEDFDNFSTSVTAEWNKFSFGLTGTEEGGYTSAFVGYEVLSYSLGAATNSTLDVYFKSVRTDFFTRNNKDDVALGAEYTVTYAPSALSVYGSANVEYYFDAEETLVTPTIGAAYAVSDVTSVWSEVSYTWVASNDWSEVGGVAAVGVDFKVAENITLTPSVVHYFDQRTFGGAPALRRDETELNLGMNFKF